MNDAIFVPPAIFLERLKLNLSRDELKANYSRSKCHHYLTIINFLNGEFSYSPINQIDRLRCYLHSFDGLAEIEDWVRAIKVLIEPIDKLSEIEDQDVLGQLQVWGYYQQIIELCQKIIERIEPEERLIIITRLANALTSLRQYPAALDRYQESLDLAKKLGKVKIRVRSIVNIGNIHQAQREYPQAIAHYQQAEKIAEQEQIDDDRLNLSIWGNQGNIFMGIGDYPNAIPLLKKSLEVVQKIGDRYAEGISYCNLGIATGGLGEYKDAQEYLSESFKIAEELDDIPGQLSALVNLGNNSSYRGDYLQAIAYHQQGLQLLADIDDEITKYNLLTGVGNGYFFLEDYAKAQTYFEASKEIADRLDYKFGIALALANLGSNVSKMGDLDLAIENLSAAIERLKQLQSLDLAAMAAHKLAEIYHRNRQPELAQAYLQFATTIAKELSLPLLSDCEELEARMKLEDLDSK